MSDFILVLISAALINHLILHKELALAPLSRTRLHALGLATALLMVLGLGIGQSLYRLVLRPWQLEYLQLFVFLPLCVLLSWLLPRLLARLRPGWPMAGLQPLLLGNVAVLGLLLQVTASDTSIGWTLAWSLAGGLGFWIALALFDDLRQRSEHPDIPLALRGLPIQLIGAGVMAMAFSGFNGLFTQ
ncbi:Rnf-Nqr domain containing protein [Pseudomonas sp. X10]